VFSLGVVLYELLVGKRPFDRETTNGTMAAIRDEEAVPPSDAVETRRVPAAVDRVIARALAKDPEERWPNMTAFAAALRASAARRSRARWVAGAVAVLALGGTAIGATLVAGGGGGGPAERPEPVATVTATRRLTTDPGCEEYPHFAGDEVVYDGLLDGDYEILAVEVATGKRRRLTHSPGWDYGSAVSPDGKNIAFIHQGTGRELRVMSIAGDEAGTPALLGSVWTGYPAWTPDGGMLVANFSDGKLHRLSLDGTSQPLSGAMPAGARALYMLSLDGHGVAVIFFRSSETPVTSLAELSTEGASRLVEDGLTNNEGAIARAPSGDAYYVTMRGAATGNQLMRRRWGQASGTIVAGGLAPHAGLDVSPDGKRLVFSTCLEVNYLALVRDGSPPRTLARGEWHDAYPVRIDDKRMAFTSDRSGPQQVWILEPESGEARPITDAGSYGGAGSSDGKELVYVSVRDKGIWRMPLAGGAPRQLTTDPTDTAPRFTRDGRVVFERSATGEQSRIWIMAADGTGARPLTPQGAYDPAPSPIDDTLVYTDRAVNGSPIVRTDLRGSPPRPIGMAGRRPRISPDGKRVLAVQSEVKVVEIPLDGSTPERVLWTATTEGLSGVEYAPDGNGVVLSISEYTGDLWLAEGTFP
jgi:Tol biopolymer transport system component